MSRHQLVVIDAPTLLDGAPQLLHQAYVEWWYQQPASRYLAELLHQTTTADVVLTADGAHWLNHDHPADLVELAR